MIQISLNIFLFFIGIFNFASYAGYRSSLIWKTFEIWTKMWLSIIENDIFYPSAQYMLLKKIELKFALDFYATNITLEFRCFNTLYYFCRINITTDMRLQVYFISHTKLIYYVFHFFQHVILIWVGMSTNISDYVPWDYKM